MNCPPERWASKSYETDWPQSDVWIQGGVIVGECEYDGCDDSNSDGSGEGAEEMEGVEDGIGKGMPVGRGVVVGVLVGCPSTEGCSVGEGMQMLISPMSSTWPLYRTSSA